ncbi:hypothetical protein Aph02nite_23960 [Actinoplanes philippinensis]|uniref:Lipoprotein n=1 Tax=Actinoplanes philippinensis TaxID=35752 RepID=A0A1I2G0U0_9ACTN|nr:hypothetical protein [Actinoplanes philippinensis]GIE76446.1 hypothetical protein Aph02nite_23960 [Actinoplanes philippinensis]SFF10376.1 hypothetical protein SAMN05421541_10657 [Actinoplanes philippinensis]
MRQIAVGLCLVVAALGGCAEPGARPEAEMSAAPEWHTFAADVSGLTPGPGATEVTAHVQLPAGKDVCARNVRLTNVTEENGTIFADIVGDSAAQHGDCPEYETVDVKLTSKTAIGDRNINFSQKVWTLRDGVYVQCDNELGCKPPADHCDDTWTRAVVRGLDVSRHSPGTVESCDEDWLVMTVPDDPTACGAQPRAGCTVDTAVWRYFLSPADTGWRLVTRTRDGGCADVVKAAPAFPEKLCRELPAPGRFVTSGPPLPASPGPRR